MCSSPAHLYIFLTCHHHHSLFSKCQDCFYASGNTQGSNVHWRDGGLSKNTATAWMWGQIRLMRVPLITPSLLWLLLTLPLTDKTCWQRDLVISAFKVFPKDSLGQKYSPCRYFRFPNSVCLCFCSLFLWYFVFSLWLIIIKIQTTRPTSSWLNFNDMLTTEFWDGSELPHKH